VTWSQRTPGFDLYQGADHWIAIVALLDLHYRADTILQCCCGPAAAAATIPACSAAMNRTTTPCRGPMLGVGRMAQLCGRWGSTWCRTRPGPSICCSLLANLQVQSQQHRSVRHIVEHLARMSHLLCGTASDMKAPAGKCSCSAGCNKVKAELLAEVLSTGPKV